MFPAFIAVRKTVPFLQSILCLADEPEGRLAKKRMLSDHQGVFAIPGTRRVVYSLCMTH